MSLGVEERLYEAASAWLAGPAQASPAAWKQQSLERFRALGLPSKKDEAWRYLPMKRVFAEASFAEHQSSLVTARELMETETRDLALSPSLVFLDGRFSPELSSTQALPQGVTLLRGPSLSQDTWASRHRAARAGSERHAIAALGAALTPEAFLLRVSGELSAPLSLIHVTTASGAAPLVFGETWVQLEEGARASVLHLFLSAPDSRAVTTHQSLLSLGENASLSETRIALFGATASLLLGAEVELMSSAHFAGQQLMLRGGVLRSELDVRLGEDAQVDLGGLALAAGDTHAEHEVRVHHVGPRSRSTQLYKTIADGAGHTAFSGRVIVDEAAKGSVAHQTNRNLLLSHKAEVDTRPQLEIYAKEVEASHGATVGQLEEEQVFYLASRGVDEENARAMLRAAFIEETLSPLDPEPLKRWARTRALTGLGVRSELSELDGGSFDVG